MKIQERLRNHHYRLWTHLIPSRRSTALPRRARSTVTLEVEDIQGNILRGYSHPHAAYVFLNVGEPASGRRLMGELINKVTTAVPWAGEMPSSVLNISFTHAGLAALGVDHLRLASFPEDFREGMAVRSAELGDTGLCAAEHWDQGLGTGEAHILVTICALDAEILNQSLAELEDKIDALTGAVRVVNEQLSQTFLGGRDHFGFVDGIAQPAIDGSGVVPRPGDGALHSNPGWRELQPGEFVLGYRDEDGLFPVAPAAPFDRNATFVVYRKMAMNTALFRRYTVKMAAMHGVDPEYIAAKIVGRWRDGTPLANFPNGPEPAISTDPNRVNDFWFAGDRDGRRCPAGSHVRRANPRDQQGFFGGILTNRHRIIRRGRPYGTPLPESMLEDDGEDRGLIFECYNASIERQFEVIQKLWIDDGDPLGCGADKDPLIGNHAGESGRMIIPGDPPIILANLPAFTRVRGGEYLLRPSLTALRWLAQKSSAEQPD